MFILLGWGIRSSRESKVGITNKTIEVSLIEVEGGLPKRDAEEVQGNHQHGGGEIQQRTLECHGPTQFLKKMIDLSFSF